MTISITDSRVNYTANGVLTVFDVKNGANGIYFETSGELEVYVDDVLQTITTHYTVAGAGSDSGTVTFLSAPADQSVVSIKRITPLTQTLSLSQATAFNPSEVMGSLDKITRRLQENAIALDRSIQLKESESGVPDDEYDLSSFAMVNIAFLGISERASSPGTPDSGESYVYVDTSGDLHFVDDAGTDVNISTSSGDAAASAAAAATSESNAATSESNAASSESNAAVSAALAASASENAALTYTFDTATAAGCASGEIRFNNAALASVTELYIHETAAAEGDVSAFLDIWDDSASPNRAYVRIYDPVTPSNWAHYIITGAQTDNGTDRTFPVSYLGSAGSLFADATTLAVFWQPGTLEEVVNDTTPALGGMLDVNGQAIGDGTRELLEFVEDASAVNNWAIENEATGGGPILRAKGDDTNIDANFEVKGTGAYNLRGTADTAAEARLFEDTDNGTNYIGLKAPSAVGSSQTFVLPDTDGTLNQAIVTDGAGNLSFGLSGGPSKGVTAGWQGVIRSNSKNIVEDITLSDHSTTFTADAGADTLDVGTDDGFSDENIVVLETTNTLPAGLSVNTEYYVVSATATTLQLSLTNGGAAINITDTGTGTHTIYEAINGSSVGPITIESGHTVTVPYGSTWTVL